MWPELRKLNPQEPDNPPVWLLLNKVNETARYLTVGTPATGNPYKVVLLYNLGRNGWSETYYWVQTGPAWSEIDKLVKGIAVGIAPFRAPGVLLDGVRVTDLVSRATKLYYPPEYPDPPNWSGNAELPAKAWFMDMYDESLTYHRKLWLHGMPARFNTFTFATGSSPNQTDGDLAQTLLTYKAFLVSNTVPTDGNPLPLGKWCIRAFAKEVPPQTSQAITDVTINPTTGTYQWTGAGVAPALGTPYVIKGNKGIGIKGLNGRATTISTFAVGVGPTIYQVTNRLPKGIGSPILTKKGTIVSSEYRYYPIANVRLVRISTKKVGKAFFVTPGRRQV